MAYFDTYKGDIKSLYFTKYCGYWCGFVSEPFLIKDTEKGYYFADSEGNRIVDVVRFNNKPLFLN